MVSFSNTFQYNICKKKLESKREALKIITKEWQLSKKEIEVYKNKVNQLVSC